MVPLFIGYQNNLQNKNWQKNTPQEHYNHNWAFISTLCPLGNGRRKAERKKRENINCQQINHLSTFSVATLMGHYKKGEKNNHNTFIHFPWLPIMNCVCVCVCILFRKIVDLFVWQERPPLFRLVQGGGEKKQKNWKASCEQANQMNHILLAPANNAPKAGPSRYHPYSKGPGYAGNTVD